MRMVHPARPSSARWLQEHPLCFHPPAAVSIISAPQLYKTKYSPTISSSALLGGNRERALEWHALPGKFPTPIEILQPRLPYS